MPTNKTRINISVPKDVNQLLIKLAKRDDIPVASKALELIKKALEIEEDKVFSSLVEERMKSTKKWHSQDEVWDKFMK